MNTLIFASNNQNKVEEIKSILNGLFDVVSLKEAGINIDIPEPHDSLEDNASEKSRTIYKLTGKDCFSEDTGLETEALHGEPGVKSARYAGEGRNFNDNIKKLLRLLNGITNRRAHFRTVVSLIINGEEHLFDGVCKGYITTHPKGEMGFGYDSVFIPTGDTRTFAEMSLEDKNVYSHRKKALHQLIEFLSQKGKKL